MPLKKMCDPPIFSIPLKNPISLKKMCDPPIFSIPLKNPKSQQKSLGLNIQTPPSHKLVVISVVVMTRYPISTGPKLCPHATHPPGTRPLSISHSPTTIP